jgi:hypothetical protein
LLKGVEVDPLSDVEVDPLSEVEISTLSPAEGHYGPITIETPLYNFCYFKNQRYFLPLLA